MIQWWGYVHVNGSLHVKRYFGPDDLSEARESDFVQDVYGPWQVNTREEAIEKLKRSKIHVEI